MFSYADKPSMKYSEGAYLTKKFQPVHQEEELVGAMFYVWSDQTEILKYFEKDWIQYWSL